MVKKAEGPDRAFFWGTDFSTQGYMKWTLDENVPYWRSGVRVQNMEGYVSATKLVDAKLSK